ncbi:MAG: helix-turn-helix transcriptional regulator [Clostridia bacterium]|nr:helix-turn-helix transcriptional regulator [Clostridia bacterium]
MVVAVFQQKRNDKYRSFSVCVATTEFAHFFYIILDNLSSVKTFCLVKCKNINMDKIFCTNLKNARVDIGYTQKQVAEKLGVVESCYANWEQGRTEPNISTLRQLGDIFSVSVDFLLGRED